MKIAVFGSTRGTDLQSIIDAVAKETLTGVTVSFVLSNKKDAYILERARCNDIKAIFLDPKGISRLEYDRCLTTLLEEHEVDLILLIGYMKLLSEEFVDCWKNKVMNIHPSLLPAYAGGMDCNVHEQVLNRGCKLTGASLIFIDKGADTGPIIMQKAVPILENDTIDTLKDRVQDAEQEILIKALEMYRDNKIQVINNKVLYR